MSALFASRIRAIAALGRPDALQQIMDECRAEEANVVSLAETEAKIVADALWPWSVVRGRIRAQLDAIEDARRAEAETIHKDRQS